MGYSSLNMTPQVEIGQQIFVMRTYLRNSSSNMLEAYKIISISDKNEVIAKRVGGGDTVTLSRNLEGFKGGTTYEGFTDVNHYQIISDGTEIDLKYGMKTSILSFLEKLELAAIQEIHIFFILLLNLPNAKATFPRSSLVGTVMYTANVKDKFSYLEEYKVVQEVDNSLYLAKVRAYDTYPFLFHYREKTANDGHVYHYLIESGHGTRIAFFHPEDYWDCYLSHEISKEKEKHQILDELHRHMSSMDEYSLMSVKQFITKFREAE